MEVLVTSQIGGRAESVLLRTDSARTALFRERGSHRRRKYVSYVPPAFGLAVDPLYGVVRTLWRLDVDCLDWYCDDNSVSDSHSSESSRSKVIAGMTLLTVLASVLSMGIPAGDSVRKEVRAG